MVASHLSPPVSGATPLETATMDSPEALGCALCYLVADLKQGFTINTLHGEVRVSAEDAPPFAREMERLLLRHIRRIQHFRFQSGTGAQ